MHHIVALLYLTKHPSYEDKVLNQAISNIALSWLQNNSRCLDKISHLEFEDGQKVLDSINRGKVLELEIDYEALTRVNSGE